MGVKIRDRMTPDGIRFQKMLKELADKEVRIGFQHGKATEDDGTDVCDWHGQYALPSISPEKRG